jgi:hypothetical protein
MKRRSLECLALSGAVAAALLQGAAALADPYAFDLRSRFVREDERDLRPPGLDVEPRIDSALLFVGNINLAENSEDEVDVAGIEAAPAIHATYRSNRADGAFDYTLIGRAFEDEDYDSVSHLLAANGRYMMVRDLLFVNAQAGYSDSVIDSSRSTNYGGTGLFNRGNMVETGRASITPSLTRQFKGLQFDASYTYGRVWYIDSNDAPPTDQLFTGFDEDSEDQRANVSLGTSDADKAATLRAFYDWQRSEYDRSLPYEYERTGLDTSLRLTRSLRLVADGGVETDLTETTTEGGLDADFWHAGFKWEPDSRTSFDARYGERFFGDSYSLQARRESKWLTLKASYSEDPEVETRRIGIDFDPDDFPIPPSPDSGTVSSTPYVAKNAMLTAIAEGVRTQLRLDLYDRKREYIENLQPDERVTGVLFNVARDIGSDLYGEFEARYQDILRGQPSSLPTGPVQFHDYDTDATLRLTWEAYTNFSTSAEAGYLVRTGDSEYDGEWFALRFRYTF